MLRQFLAAWKRNRRSPRSVRTPKWASYLCLRDSFLRYGKLAISIVFKEVSGVASRAISSRPLPKRGRHNANAAACGAPFDFVKIGRQRLEQDRSGFCDPTPDDNEFGVEDIDE